MEASRLPSLLWAAVSWAAFAGLGGCQAASTPPALQTANAASVPPWSRDEAAAYLAKITDVAAIPDAHARCIAAPDLPGNHWPSGAARSRCDALLEGPWPIARIEALLSGPDGGKQLDQAFSSAQAAYAQSPRQHPEWERAFEAFKNESRDLPEVSKTAEAWLSQSPRSVYAMTAVGLAYLNNAWRQRGGGFISQTSRQQLDAMQRWLDRARPVLQEAVAIDPHQGYACAALLDIVRMGSGPPLGQDTVDRCAQAEPDLPNYLNALRLAAMPRWGGSWQALASFDAFIEAPAQENPALAYMRHTTLLERGMALQRDKQPAAALPLMIAVATDAPHGAALAGAARGLQEAGQFDDAMVYMTQAIRFEPRNVAVLNELAEMYQKHGDHAQAVRILQDTVDRGLASPGTYTKLAISAEKLGDYATAKQAYTVLLQEPRHRQWAQTCLCDIVVRREHDPSGALACTQALVAALPDDPMANFMRAWVLTQQHDPGAEAAAQRFFSLPQGTDPRQAQMTTQLQELRAGKRQ
ncbi:DUF4034 domain-containing protein [Pseudoxanthomonas winnipegensis]|uniref:tetratricopeptide repeat protein n=1 Tax=Pseudoxanthomonas winnipegensis TaxID=2480810 RepID=UPI0025760048|nr:tetratricopeptide repeat protein [Pseudoxanthomonas winnipegensis]WJI14780.1 DUF4034 domain-containing protein [Pseudoxanthomonas winnipegensis]